MPERVHRVGVIGADTRASWAQVSHIPAIHGLASVTLSAVATRHEDSAREAAAAFGASHWFADPYRMITDDSVDIVTIAVKVPAHRDLVLAAAAAGKVVYCESPLGVSPAEAAELAAAARSRPSAIGLQGRLNPAVRRAARLIGEGAIGRPLNARVVSTSAAFGPSTYSAYRYFEEAGSGAHLLTITGGHTLDVVEALLGDVVEVDARAETLWPHPVLADVGGSARREVPDHVDVLARTASGAVVTVGILGGVAPEDARFTFELRGSDGWLTLTGGSIYGVQGADLTLTSSARFEDTPAGREPLPGPALNVAEVYASLVADLDEGTRTTPGFDHAVHNSELVAAVGRAAESGQRWSAVTSGARR
ncbi:Gfo/Idh/MocA family oxidoreductase [Amycolatopsis sp., V23-08]|uniref:Gfo/Idh/MocA family oxidoreductase n=1 Tax=Amycolatopsis heterodermiae TaxID=3110235 RepID=A0ABU5R9J8_9PSEU|nr:Gfo/Idh/MocA family oxidoreductase [Amycolatopsis sp., V23-08]MEA5362320.1 Gfo/Idh/MocA family oxidoreductase [Amycolatopsis sp., V23-08]